MIDGYLTSDEAADRLGVTRRTLYNLAKDSPGFPKPTKIGRTLLWPIAGLDTWRAAHPPRRRKPKPAE